MIRLDEFAVKKRMFDATISDLEQRTVLGIIEGCGKGNLEKYFTALPDPEIVEVVVMDMHETSHMLTVVAVKAGFAQADRIAHVIWASRTAFNTPYIIVEDDVDPFNMPQVLHAW